jgi:arylsulfatase A-like enzyme
LTGAKIPASVKPDGVSVLPALLGGAMPKRTYFYWELHEGGSQQAVRFGDWKAVKRRPSAAVELYDLKADPAEQHDVAAAHPAELQRAKDLIAASRTPSELWPMREPPAPRNNRGARAGQGRPAKAE